MSAADLAGKISVNVDDWYGNRISFHAFKTRQNALWRQAEKAKCEAEVSRLIWAAMPDSL